MKHPQVYSNNTIKMESECAGNVNNLRRSKHIYKKNILEIWEEMLFQEITGVISTTPVLNSER